MATKLTAEQKEKAENWFRKNRLPDLEEPDKVVRFRVKDELDANGRVQFVHSIIER